LGETFASPGTCFESLRYVNGQEAHMPRRTRSATRRSSSFALVSGLMLLGAYGCATAPPAVTFSDLAARVARGNTVYVTDAAGRERKGRIGAVSADALTLEVDGTRQVIEARDVRQVERYGDALWNGMAIGAGIGTVDALISDPRYRPCPDRPERQCADAQVSQRLLLVGVMGAAGAGIDALHRHRHLVYQTPGQTRTTPARWLIRPALGRSSLGVVVDVAVRGR
jgi:hypothetical protein